MKNRALALVLGLYAACILAYAILAWVQHEHWHLVTWDSFFYKGLFWGLLRESPFRLENHFRVSPLYPLSLLPSGLFSNYMAMVYAQLILSAAYYFSGIFPLFFLGRSLGGAWTGLLSATLFAVYPASIYCSWTMSEAVAIPVFLWLFWLLAEILVAPTKGKVAGAGLAAGLVLLSRPQGLFAVPALLLLAGLCQPRRLATWANLGLVGILGAFLAGLVWWKLGYISMSGNALTYLPNLENTPTVLGLIPRGLYQIFLHATALWMEGALLLPTLGILGLWMSFRERGSETAPGEASTAPTHQCLLARFTALGAGFLLLAVSIFVARFLPDEGSRPVLRYAVYTNLILIPFAAKALLGCTLPASIRFRSTAALSILFAQPLLWPRLWKELAELGGYFSNAPALDVYMQMNDLPGWQVALITASVAFAAVNLCLRYRLIAVALPLVLSLVVTRHAWDVCIEAPRKSHERMGFSDIHAFCREVEMGRWRETHIFTQWTPHVDYLMRYVKFFTGFPNIHDGPAPPDQTDYLFLTFDTVPDATLEWEGQRLHAYRMNPPPKS